MCGIGGIIAPDPDVVRTALVPMTAVQTHRGPDDAGEQLVPFGSYTLGLGHRRLSILDLSVTGHQPMQHPETGDWLVYNGEIYNFQRLRAELERAGAQFKGHSDTEVLLHGLIRWGPDVMTRLEGMFALAFYSAADQRLLLARDPVGIKPLYVAQAPGLFSFASEVRALLASGQVPRRINARAAAGMLAYGAIQEPDTFFDGVEAFPPGCHAWVDPGAVERGTRWQPQRYWRVPAPSLAVSEHDAVHAVRGILGAAVRDHLVSDVPVGVFLSSGLDSTVVASLAARHTSHLRTFTVDYVDQPGLSESPLATKTAQRIGAAHTNIAITGEDALAAMNDWLETIDQPSVDGLNTYVISKAVHGAGIIVAISGLGGDELFCGYNSFSVVPRSRAWLRALGWLPVGVRRGLAHVMTVGKPAGVRNKAADMASTEGGLLELYLNCRRALTNAELDELGVRQHGVELADGYLAPEALAGLDVNEADPIWTVSLLEVGLYMRNTLLRDSDANGMAHSLEIRVPLLDRRLLDYALALPGDVRQPTGQPSKHLLRRAFADCFPPELTAQEKRGFTLPIGRWMVGPLRELCASGVDHLESTGLLRPEGTRAIWDTYLSSRDRTRWARAFALCVLGLYAKRMGV